MDYIYGLTVQGIQSYIFATNNLREIIGGSEIVQAVCTDWFDEFLSKPINSVSANGLKLQNAAGNIKYITSIDGAKNIYKGFGEFINNKAPGLPFSQAIAPSLETLEVALSAQRNIPQHHFDLGHMSRFLARVTGDLAVNMKEDDQTKEGFANYKKKRDSIDAENFQKFKMSYDAKDRLCNKANIKEKWLAHDFEDMAKGGKHNWLSLIHIDGNGMGKHIMALADKFKNDQAQRSNAIKDFAQKFSDCTERAFMHAFNTTFDKEFLKTENGIKKLKDSKKEIPFRPLILGGDDVTVILRADFAIQFVQAFLVKFEELTQNDFKGNFIVEENGQLQDKFTACAGIAFVKAKFPFHYTTHLAEELCSAAKEESERKKSALLFHKVSDSFITNYEELKKRELTIHKGKPNEMGISKKYYDLDDLVDFLKKTKNVKAEKGVKNAMRQWMDLTLNESPEAILIDKRAEKKYGTKWTNIKKNQLADYLTLLAVS
ncbi:hypothetical protein SAMN06298216_4439 [Spirosomataceae bacterium TFI 002]|nr:hypothetical protein SAMN06298216_4439 [Spirosomataceae bacterium TFI 002]